MSKRAGTLYNKSLIKLSAICAKSISLFTSFVVSFLFFNKNSKFLLPAKLTNCKLAPFTMSSAILMRPIKIGNKFTFTLKCATDNKVSKESGTTVISFKDTVPRPSNLACLMLIVSLLRSFCAATTLAITANMIRSLKPIAKPTLNKHKPKNTNNVILSFFMNKG